MKESQLVRKIIKEYMEMREDLKRTHHYEDIDLNSLPIPEDCQEKIRMLYFMICLDPESTSYGKGKGAFVYNEEAVYQFTYNIHTPTRKGPHQSNQMDNIQQVVWFVDGEFESVKCVETNFGARAFLDNTSSNWLDTESYMLLLLIKAVQMYCRGMDYCRILRKKDRAHEEWKALRHLRVVESHSIYGSHQVMSHDILEERSITK